MTVINKLLFTWAAVSALSLYGMNESQAPSTSDSSVAEPTYNRYKGVRIEAASLEALMPQASREAQEFVSEHEGLFKELMRMPESFESIQPLIDSQKEALRKAGFRNLSRSNWTFAAKPHIYKVAGVPNKIACRKADNNMYDRSAKEVWSQLKAFLHTYQTSSSVAYYLMARQAIDTHQLQFEIPITSVVRLDTLNKGIVPAPTAHPHDTNCVVVQEWVPGTWERITPANRDEISDKQVEEAARLIRYSTLWSINDNLKRRAEDGALGDFDLEQPNNSKSIDFFNGWTPTHPSHPTHPNFKAVHNAQNGLEELASLFKGDSKKIAIIKDVAHNSGFLAEIKEAKGEAALDYFIQELEKYKKAE
jgi:hypothetical protein